MRKPVTRLGEILAAEGRKQVWLSEQTGIHGPDLSRIVNGRMNATEDERSRIAEALGRQIADVFPADSAQVAA